MRELTRMASEPERERLTRARIVAFAQLSSKIFVRNRAYQPAKFDPRRGVSHELASRSGRKGFAGETFKVRYRFEFRDPMS